MYRKNNDLTEGPLWSKIILFALPVAVSGILQQLFNTADSIVVGRFCGPQALAAVGSNNPTINLIINLFMGLSIGTNVMISQAIGRKDFKEVSRGVTTSLITAAVSGVLLIFLGNKLARPLLNLLNTPADVIELSEVYLKTLFLGMPFMMLYNFASAILRAKGDTRNPLIALAISGVVNVLLNLLFVIRMDGGVKGVAFATVISNAMAAAITLIVVKKEPLFRWEKFTFSRESFSFMLRIGIPSGLQGSVFSTSNMMIIAAVNTFGSSAVAGNSAANYLTGFNYFVISAFNQAALTFVSQNWGAAKPDRCKKSSRLCLWIGMTTSAVICFSYSLFRHQLIGLFSSDKEVLHYAFIRMKYMQTFQWMITGYEVLAASLRGMGKSGMPAVLTLIGICGFRALWLLTVFQSVHTYSMLCIIYPASWIVTNTIMGIYYIKTSRKLYAKLKREG